VFDAFAPGHESSDLAVAGGGLEDPAEDLDGGRLPRPVRTNETEQLAVAEREADALEGFDDPVASSEETRDGSERPAGSLGDRNVFVRPSTTIIATYLRPPFGNLDEADETEAAGSCFAETVSRNEAD
jgi:hypothetical protein